MQPRTTPSHPHSALPTPTPIWHSLFDSGHWGLDEDRGHRLMRARRSDKPMHDLNEIEHYYAFVREHVATLKREQWSVLVDLRAAPMRNDPAFEEKIRPMASGMFVGFKRTAILVRTQVGKLQVNRTRRENGNVGANANVFLDEAEAIAFLIG